MKTTIRLVAVAAAVLASNAVFAESALTLYGTLDASLTNTKTTSTGLGPISPAGSTSTTAVSSGVMTGSFIGLKGTEDLGNGMEAQFVLESYLNLDTGATSASTQLLSAATRAAIASPTATWNTRDTAGSFWSRAAYVGLKTPYGLVRLGQMDSLGYLAAGNYNPFGHASISPSRIFYTTDFYAQGWSNTLGYYIKLADVTIAVQHAPRNDAAGAGNGAKTSAAVRYTAGAFSTSLGYETNKDNVAAAGSTAKSWALHGSYDFGVVKAYAQYGKGKLDATADVKSTGYQLGASVPVGNGAFLASFANGKQTFEATGTKFRDNKVLSVGYDHNLSKRTDAYVTYSEEKDNYPVASLLNLKTKTQSVAVGVRHRF